jgi:rubrerythrin
MSRYIDADKLINPDNIIVMQDETGIDEFPYTYTNAVKVETILKAPTADVVEVRHGEWTKSSPYNRFMNCSVCGFGQDHTTFKYCPNCGAKMDGERKQENGT